MAIAKVQREGAEAAVVAVLRSSSPFAWAEPIDDEASEFRGEVKAIAKQLSRIGSSRDAAHAIARVFDSSFHSPNYKTESWPDEAGELLWTELLKRDLV